MKSYKRLPKDLTCNGHKYELGVWEEFPKAKLCEAGAHSCLDPLDTSRYYSPAESDIYECEIDDVSDERGGDSKVVSKRIMIGAKLDIAGIIKAHAEYVQERCTEEKSGGNGSSLSGGNRSSLSGGDWSSLSGGYGSSLSGGDGSVVVSRGKSSVGENGMACARGNGCKVKGGMGAVLVISEEKTDDYELVAWKAVVVDGENVKADTWYKLENGELVEAE